MNISFIHKKHIGIIIFLISSLLLMSQDYNKSADYAYQFNENTAQISPITIEDNTIKIKDIKTNNNTALLKLNISAKGSETRLPYVSITCGKHQAIQYFESKDKGIRYINLSEFTEKGESILNLNFHHCKSVSPEAELILYPNTNLENKTIIILSPHPDDAEIAAYGLYATAPNVYIVNITVGDAGKKMYDELYPDDSIHYIKKTNIRLWNSLTIPMLAGVSPQNIINLGYFDASLKTMYENRDSIVSSRYTGLTDINIYRQQNFSELIKNKAGTSTWTSLIDDMTFLVQTLHPDIIVTPYPAIDVHNDHQLTTLAMVNVLQELGQNNVELWMYSNHFVNSEYYPFGTDHSIISLPPVFEDSPIYFDRLYSHSLSPTLQSDKTIALECMAPLRPDTEWHTTKGAKTLYKKTKKENKHYSENDYYFRRAVRNNELFFIVKMSNLESIDLIMNDF